MRLEEIRSTIGKVKSGVSDEELSAIWGRLVGVAGTTPIESAEGEALRELVGLLCLEGKRGADAIGADGRRVLVEMTAHAEHAYAARKREEVHKTVAGKVHLVPVPAWARELRTAWAAASGREVAGARTGNTADPAGEKVKGLLQCVQLAVSAAPSTETFVEALVSALELGGTAAALKLARERKARAA